MDKRLKAVKSLIRPGIGVIDVGTDHGYIPVALSKEGYKGNIIACDINQGPLSAAKANAEKAGVTNIDFRLSNGLEKCGCTEADTIIIAGLGGDIICSIIDNASWLQSSKYNIILQPMTKPEVLRYFLTNNGFEILRELNVEDSGRIYAVIQSSFTGRNQQYSDAQLFTGKNPCIKLAEKALKSVEKKRGRSFYKAAAEEIRGMTDDRN